MSKDQMTRKVLVVENGEENEVDLSKCPAGEEFLYLGKNNYPVQWKGEDKMYFREEEGLSYINDKLSGVNVDQVDIEQIPQSEDITSLNLAGERFPELSRFPNLLALSAHDVTDAHTKHLLKVSGLRVLDLGLSAAITDDGLSHISALSDLRWLNLLKTSITDTGLLHLSKLSRLSILWLADTGIIGHGLAHLSGLTCLRTLGLTSTGATDADIEFLESLPVLDYLNLKSTAVSESCINRIKKALPDCVVMSDYE